MAVTKASRSIQLTAAADTVVEPIKVTSIRVVGTGLTPGQRLTLKEGGINGSVIVDHYVGFANEDAEVFGPYNPGRWIKDLYVTAVPASGGVVLVNTQ